MFTTALSCCLLSDTSHSVQQGVLLLQYLLWWTEGAKRNSECATPIWQGFHALVSHGYKLLYNVQGEQKSCAYTHSDGKRCSRFQDRATHLLILSSANLFAPLSAFCSVGLEKHFTITDTVFQMGFQPYLKLAGGVYFFFPFHKKEKKYTWPGMLLMFLPINLSTSSVGYWIRYTFLCSNKLFKFLNIKGSKRKKLNFHRRE